MNQKPKRPHSVPNVLKAVFHHLPLAMEHNPKSSDQQINHLPLTENQIMAIYPYLQTPVTTDISSGHHAARSQAAPVSFRWQAAAIIARAKAFCTSLLAQPNELQGSVRELLVLERFKS